MKYFVVFLETNFHIYIFITELNFPVVIPTTGTYAINAYLH
jgi:hypothetical protein